MEPRFNEHLYNEVLDETNDFLYPSNSKILKKNLDITKPRSSVQILSVTWPFVNINRGSTVVEYSSHQSLFLSEYILHDSEGPSTKSKWRVRIQKPISYQKTIWVSEKSKGALISTKDIGWPRIMDQPKITKHLRDFDAHFCVWIFFMHLFSALVRTS